MSTPDIPADIQTLTAWADPGECEWVDGPSSYCVAHDAYSRMTYGEDVPCRGVDLQDHQARQALVRILTHLTQN